MVGQKRSRVRTSNVKRSRPTTTRTTTRTTTTGPRQNVSVKVPAGVTSSWVDFGYGFPQKVKMTHKYYEQFNLNSALGILTTYQFRANGMYDPNITGTGHQPQFFDQMNALYNHWVVVGSKITIMPSSNIDSSRGFQIVAYLNDDSTTAGDFESAVQQPNSVNAVYAPGRDNPNLELTFSAKKMFGGNVLNNNRLLGNNVTDPPEQTVYTIHMKATDPSATDCNVAIAVLIEYIAVWVETKDIAKS